MKNVTLGVGFLIVVSTPSYLVYDLLKVAWGEANVFRLFLITLLTLIVVACAIAVWKSRTVDYERVKSIMERPVALFLFSISSPILLLSAALIKLESRGPIIYRQLRIGKNRRRAERRKSFTPDRPSNRRRIERRQHDLGGAPFHIFKLRSMYTDAEAKTGVAWAAGDDDPRVTRVGRYLRKTHVDEIPQLLNVLFGQMSIIGPRPERPEFITELSEIIDGYRERLRVSAGITGLAQVRQDSDKTIEDVKRKLRHDKEYIEHMSLLLDAKIAFLTLLLILRLLRDSFKRTTAVTNAEPTPQSVLLEKTHQTGP